MARSIVNSVQSCPAQFSSIQIMWLHSRRVLGVAVICSFLQGICAVTVRNVEVSNCGSKTDPIKLLDLKVEGKDDGVMVSMQGNTTVNLTSPIRAEYKVLKKTLFGNYRPLRLLTGKVKDMCEFGKPENEECPQDLKELKVPCRCPVEMNTVVAINRKFKFPPQFVAMQDLLVGDFRGILLLHHNKEQLACFVATFAVS